MIAPVFMFGFERSGTTLLAMMVGAHPRIAVPLSVTGLWYRYARRLDEFGSLHTPADVERLVDALLAEERIRLWDVELSRAEVLSSLAPGSYAHVVACFHECYARRTGKALWANIDIDTLFHLDQAYAWFPQARFIHIVRDGRDVALSHQTYAFGASNIGECIDQWERAVQVNLKMGAILGPQRYLLVRYEDLVTNPAATLGHVCDFIGVPYADEMLRYPELTVPKIPADRRWLWPLLAQPPAVANVFRWKHQMGRTQEIVCERCAHTLLAHLGYEVAPRPPRSIAAQLLELWYFLGRGHRFRRLHRRLRPRAAAAAARQRTPIAAG